MHISSSFYTCTPVLLPKTRDMHSTKVIHMNLLDYDWCKRPPTLPLIIPGPLAKSSLLNKGRPLWITYFPWAVSPESIMASAPSRTAIAISDTSARVGVGWLIILSSMLLATITGFPIALHDLIISPCHETQSPLSQACNSRPSIVLLPH